MRKSEMTNEELLVGLSNAAFKTTNYPKSATKADDFEKYLKETARRMGADMEEINKKM